MEEHLARRWGLDIPAWADDPRRFLGEPHFPEGLDLMNSILLGDGPIGFRRRLMFTDAELRRQARHLLAAELRRNGDGGPSSFDLLPLLEEKSGSQS